MNPLRKLLCLAAASACCLLPASVQAQWLTQSVLLKPGWNAVYLHVDASHSSLDDLIPSADDPVAEVWLWRPTPVTMQFVDRPQQPTSQGSQWSVWTATRGDLDTLGRLVGNAAYLVRNGSATDYVWNVKGKPLAPSYTWTSTGLNFLGFPTPQGGALSFDKFLAPAPGLDLAKSAANGAQLIRYIGGDLGDSNPKLVSPLEARSIVANRGEAFWIQASTNYYNRFYGPVEVSLQSPSGMNFGETMGAYSFHLKNLTTSARTVVLNLFPSEAPPSGQPALAGAPQLLVRGPRSATSFSYAHTVLNGNSFTLPPAGEPGSDREVVIGLNRTAMTAGPGSLYAGVLRVTDTDGFSQIDVPVTAKVPNLGGLWIGEASVDQVGQYLKSYPKITASTTPPRSSFLDLDGTTGLGKIPAPIPFNTGVFTVESWVNLRRGQDLMPLAGFQIVPEANPAGPSTLVSLNLTASGGRLLPNIAAPLVLDAPMFPDDGRSLTATTSVPRNFAGTNSQGGQIIGFDLTLNGLNDNWGGFSLGAAESAKEAFVAAADPHFGVIFRVNGRLVAFDGAQNLSPGEPVWTASNPTLVQHHFDVVCTDPTDGNPFDGTGSTRIEIYVDGGAAPVFSYTKGGGGYSQNFINFQPFNLSLMRVRNLTIGGLAKPIISANSLTPGQWTHVAMVAQGGTGKIYLNGSKVAEGVLPAAFAGIITNGFVGGNPVSAAPAAAGLDDFRLWSTARSEQDIRRDMAIGRHPAGTSGLALQYDFPAVGDVGVDSGGNGRNLAIQGSATRGSSTLSPSETMAANLAVAVAVANRPAPGSELPGADWVNRTPDTSRTYSAIASSQNGGRLIAAALGAGGRLYVSSDAGATWAPTGPATVSTWTAVASSSGGDTLAAVASGAKIYVSTDSGATWTARESERSWSSIALSEDGRKMAATDLGGKIYTSVNTGVDWTPRESLRNWNSIASSSDGQRLIASVSGGNLYISTNAGVSWTQTESVRSWSDVASSSDGLELAAVVNTASTGGQIYTSTDGGTTWTPRETNRAWTGVAVSGDGSKIAAVAAGVGIYSSTDGGASWSLQEIGRNWKAVSTSADGSRLAAVVSGGGIHTRTRSFASYTLDEESGLIKARDGSYISTGVNTNLARTASALPLRLILHGDTAANSVKLMQRVFVGQGAATTNIIAASSEALLDPAQLSTARRISAAHLPFSDSNTYWPASGQLVPGTALNFTVPLDYNDHVSNPFLHTFHPDHDNLQSDFKRVEAIGVESYGITRQIRLTFNAPGNDFASLTASSQSLGGVYEETITLAGRAGSSRQFRLSGSFSIHLISPIATLTTQ